MDKTRWWTLDTIFVVGTGVLMTAVLAISLFARLGSSTGSDLVPAATLQQLRDQEARCQTIDRDHPTEQQAAPRTRC
jgi:hypothetical protein